jgi:hypothetical protein
VTYHPGTTEENHTNPVKMAVLWADICSQCLPNLQQDYQPSPILISTETANSEHKKTGWQNNIENCVSANHLTWTVVGI